MQIVFLQMIRGHIEKLIQDKSIQIMFIIWMRELIRAILYYRRYTRLQMMIMERY